MNQYIADYEVSRAFVDITAVFWSRFLCRFSLQELFGSFDHKPSYAQRLEIYRRYECKYQYGTNKFEPNTASYLRVPTSRPTARTGDRTLIGEAGLQFPCASLSRRVVEQFCRCGPGHSPADIKIFTISSSPSIQAMCKGVFHSTLYCQ